MRKYILGRMYKNPRTFNVVHIFKKKGIDYVNIQEFRDGEPYRRGVVMPTDQLDDFMGILSRVKSRIKTHGTKLYEYDIADESI